MAIAKNEKRGGYEIDMTNGPLLGKIIRFAIPLAISGVLQLLFNAADTIVAGRFAGSTALAAVGSTASLIQLITNLFMGLSVGVNVLVARYYGAGDSENLRDTVHTAVLVSVMGGIILVFLGVGLSRPLLSLMGTPDDVIDQSVLYMRIYFMGMPAMMLYNYGASILRAVGDTRRPLYFLIIAGIINVILNLISVIAFGLGVAGVAIATVASQVISAFLVLRCLIKSDNVYRVEIKKLRINGKKFLDMMKIGLPAGIQGAMFSISNVLIQSSVNSFGSIAMAGNTAAGSIEGFVFMAEDSMTQAALSFTGQNLGAKKYDRVNRVLFTCILMASAIGMLLGGTAYLFGRPLLSIYTSDSEAISYGMRSMLVKCLPHFTCALMNVVVGALRGLGSSLTPMVVSVFGVCVLRVVWIYTVFAAVPTWEMLFISYPVTWVVTFVLQLICYVIVRKRLVSKSPSTESAV